MASTEASLRSWKFLVLMFSWKYVFVAEVNGFSCSSRIESLKNERLRSEHILYLRQRKGRNQYQHCQKQGEPFRSGSFDIFNNIFVSSSREEKNAHNPTVMPPNLLPAGIKKSPNSSYQFQYQNELSSPALREGLRMTQQQEEYPDMDDSMERFQKDVDYVLTTLKPLGQDPGLRVPFRNRYLSYTQLWTNEMWDDHSSRWRYFRFVSGFPTSRLLRRIAPQVTIVIVWSLLITCRWSPMGRFLGSSSKPPTSFSWTTPLSLVSTFVAALLTLRSNQALSRVTEGRLAWGRCVLLARDTAQLLKTTLGQKPQLTDGEKLDYILAARHLSLFSWLLKCRLSNEDDTDIIHAMLSNEADRNYVMERPNHASAVITRVRQIITPAFQKTDSTWSLAEQSALQQNLSDLHRVAGMCERIRSSPVPPLYTSHLSRLLLFYLAFLPLALRASTTNIFHVVLTMTSVSYAMLGLDEISHLLEQPFRLMPIYQVAWRAMSDVSNVITTPLPDLPSLTFSPSLSTDTATNNCN